MGRRDGVASANVAPPAAGCRAYRPSITGLPAHAAAVAYCCVVCVFWLRSCSTALVVDYFMGDGICVEFSSNTGAVYISRIYDSQAAEAGVPSHFYRHGEPLGGPEASNGLPSTRLLPLKAFRVGSRRPGPGGSVWYADVFVVSYWLLLLPGGVPAAVALLRGLRAYRNARG